MALRDYYHTILDLFYPRTCFHCNCNLNDSSEAYLCHTCRDLIPYVKDTCCTRCGATQGPYATVKEEEGCSRCKGKKFHFDAVTPVTHFDGVARDLIHKFKYAKLRFLCRTLNEIVTTRPGLKQIVQEVDVIVPVPLHWLKKFHRGFNQSELLSRGIQNHFPKPVSTKNLCRVRNTVSQTYLSKTKRQENVHNAFKVRRPGLFAGKSILLVDDVLTTGVTASECARKLKEAGAGRVHLFVLAIAEQGK